MINPTAAAIWTAPATQKTEFKLTPEIMAEAQKNEGITIKVADEQLHGRTLELSNNIDAYSGYRQDGDSATHINVLNQDLDVADLREGVTWLFQEVGGVKGKMGDDERANIMAQVIDTKLNPGSNIDFIQAGKDSGRMTAEYGISDFTGVKEHGDFDDVYTANTKQLYSTNSFSAKADIVTDSGNQISMQISYFEQLDTSKSSSIGKGSLESMEDYNARFAKIMASTQLPISESDYRSVSISYTSSSPLTKQESGNLNQLTSSILSTANSASRGQMVLEGYDLNGAYSDVKELFKSVEIDAMYQGNAQGKTEIEMSLLEGRL